MSTFRVGVTIKRTKDLPLNRWKMTSEVYPKDEFDHRKHNRYKPWPLDDVLRIEWDSDVASRIALGILHVTPSAQVKPIAKPITIA